MVASDSDAFLGSAGDALAGEGAVVICVESIDGAIHAVEDGFRPEVLVIDGTMKSGPDLMARVRRELACDELPVIVAAPVRDPTLMYARGVRIVALREAVVGAVQAMYFGLA